MGGSFFGLNVALRGLYTSQRNLDVVSHNISNASTPGYSRQVANQQASQPLGAFDGTGMIGTGSDIVSVDRIRDEYLDFKFWSESVTYGEWSTKDSSLSDIQATFNEPSDSGISTNLDDFYTSLQELQKDPSDGGIRSLVKERGVAITKQLNNMASKFEKLQSDLNYNVQTKVGEINSLASQIKQVNDQIYRAELDGNKANDLRDQRTVLIDKLSSITNIEVSEVTVPTSSGGNDDKRLVIAIGGKVLVDYHGTNKLVATPRGSTGKMNVNEEIDGLYDVYWEDGTRLPIKGGELKGYLEARDGNEGVDEGNGPSPTYKGIPYYIKQINTFARTFAQVFNEGYNDGTSKSGHAGGYDSYGNTGIRFFTIDGQDPGANLPAAYYNGITAKNIGVNVSIQNDVGKIATSSAPDQAGNGENLNNLLSMRHYNSMFTEGAPEDFIKSVISTMGIDAQQAKGIMDNQDNIVKQIENRRSSDSGVSLDEEMANLVKYQHSYNAAAKMISTMAQIYDTLINRTVANG